MEEFLQFRILLIDQSKENLITLSYYLSKAGFTSDNALCVKDALPLLIENKYGLVILDSGSCENNPIEDVKLIKSNSKKKNLPVIIITDDSQRNDSFPNFQGGAGIFFLTKPFDETLFLLKVRNCLQLHKSNLLLKKANRKLKRKAARAKISFQDLYNSLPLEIYLINRDGIIVNINRTGLLCCGMNARDLLNKHYTNFQFLNKIFSIGGNENLLRYSFEQHGAKKRLELQSKKTDKKIFYYDAEISSVLIDGKFHVQVSVSDITEKKKCEEKILESDLQLNIAQSMGKIGSWEYNIESQKLIWSDELYRIFEIENISDFDLMDIYKSRIHPGDVEKVFACFDNALTNGTDYEINHSIILPNGSVKHLYCIGKAKKNESGIIVKLSGTSQDITESIIRETELKKTVNELYDRYNQLMQFNYIVSHNLRAPIANILGLANILNLPGTEKKEGRKILEYIRTATVNMDELLKDLSVILSTRSALNTKKENVHLPDLVKSISNSLEKQIQETGYIIDIEISESAKEIFTIKSYLESILYNLISNSIKYKSPVRSPKIILASEKIRENIVMKVSDNGIGIDLNKHSRSLFGMYKRFNVDVEGKGLGLHMTKTQVEVLGGKIDVESKLGNGTTFIITLPAKS